MRKPAQQPSRHLAPGDKLGKYDLIRQIAVGGMAELYLARTLGIEGFEKLVVVKRILPHFASNASFVNMFLNEARLAATIVHPNVAQVYDIGVEDGDYFFAMEYIHGEDLDRISTQSHDQGVPVSMDAALTLIAGLCAGLHYAHDRVGADGKALQIVHRDVSPSNVLVSYDGAVKLVDFGIARAMSGKTNTTQGGLKGKITYMSPEQCRSEGVLDRRSDIYSIGTLLYELTTGRTPFVGETEYAVLNQIVNSDVPPPSKIVPNYPPALERIVLRALAREPAERYATAIQIQGDIEDFAHESRLRVSPLVLARLMSTLFPARLEEWDNAKSQGAFFVEQHVLQTLIESGKSDPVIPAPQLPPEPPEEETTTVNQQSMDTGNTAVDVPPMSEPLRFTSPPQRPPTPVAQRPPQPSSPQRMPTPAPHRTTPSQPMASPMQRNTPPPQLAQRMTPSQPMPMQRNTPPPQMVRANADPAMAPTDITTPLTSREIEIMPSAPAIAITSREIEIMPSEPMPQQSFVMAQTTQGVAPTRMPTPSGGHKRMPTPVRAAVPGMPGAVPIIGPVGTLVTPSGAMDAVARIPRGIELTERVRVVPKPRRRTPVIALVSLVVIAGGIGAFITLRGGDELDGASKSEPAKPAETVAKPEPTEEPAKPEPEKPTEEAAKPEPVKPIEVAKPEAAKPEPVKPIEVAKPEPAKPEPVKAIEVAKPEPAKPEPVKAIEVAKPEPAKPVKPIEVAKPDKPKIAHVHKQVEPKPKPAEVKVEPKPKPAEVKVEPKPKPIEPKPKPEEKPWNADSPFMPVRTDKH